MNEDRAFLERSLADLDREHEVGDLDDSDYARLGRHYRRRLDELGTVAPAKRAPRRRTIGWIVGTLIVATLAGVLLARTAGQRLPGDTLVKGDASGSRELLAQARAALGPEPKTRAVARDLYAKVLVIEPGNIEALTYTAWIDRLDTKLAVDSGTLSADVARPKFTEIDATFTDVATKDPKLADAHCFQAVLRFRDLGDAAGARSAYEQCQSRDPSQQVQGLVAKLGSEIDTELTKSTDLVTAGLASARLIRDVKPTDALKRYDDVLKVDPTNAEARTWKAWTKAKVAAQAGQQGLLDDAKVKAIFAEQVAALEQVRSDSPTAGDAPCILVTLHVSLDDKVDIAPALADCRSRVASREVRDLAIANAAPSATATTTQ